MARFGRHYRPDSAGLRELGRSAEVSSLCLDAAQRGAAWANQADPAGTYVATRAAVPAGWDNQYRSGARVEQTEFSRVGPRDRVLVRAVNVVEEG